MYNQFSNYKLHYINSRVYIFNSRFYIHGIYMKNCFIRKSQAFAKSTTQSGVQAQDIIYYYWAGAFAINTEYRKKNLRYVLYKCLSNTNWLLVLLESAFQIGYCKLTFLKGDMKIFSF